MSAYLAPTRRGDPSTSFKAARAVTPARPTIRRRVDDFARGRGPDGFMDVEMDAALMTPSERARGSSSYRTRRSELTAENIILDTGREGVGGGNSNDRRIWVHRDHHPDPGPIVAAVRGAARDILKGEAMAHAAKLRLLAAGLRRQGLGPAAYEVEQGAELLTKLAR